MYYDRLRTSKNTKTSGRGTCLFLIDPQNDFVLPTGTLCVPGAVEDCERLRAAIMGNLSKIDAIIITMDTHQKMHIAHPMFWQNQKNEQPTPFTVIAASDVLRGKWRTSNPEHQSWATQYVQELEKGGRFALTIWPEHCLVGTQGHAVYAPLMEAIHAWEAHKGTTARFIFKGNNAFTEHYSAIRAEVPMKEDPNTSLNKPLVDYLATFNKIVIAGEALSHCVNFTVRDLLAHLPAVNNDIVLVSDGASSVQGYEAAGAKFCDDMKAKGIQSKPAANVF